MKDITVLVTMVGGEIVYQKDDFSWEESLSSTPGSSVTTEPSTTTPSWTFSVLRIAIIALKKLKR